MRHTGQHGAHVRDLTEFPAQFAVRPVGYAIARVLVPRWYTPVNFSPALPHRYDARRSAEFRAPRRPDSHRTAHSEAATSGATSTGLPTAEYL